jgi:prepilin-type N-terminal cleavage/methylation domain-containing protein
MRRRSGFTLTELLVVIAILLLLSTLAFAVFNTGRSSDRMRSGARTAQSAFLGAKDRALHAKDLRGVRLTRDPSNLTLVNGFVYLQPLPVQSTGNFNGATTNNFSITRPGLSASPSFTDAIQINITNTGTNTDGQTYLNQDSAGIWPYSTVQVRIPSGTGQWYQLARQNNNAAPYWVTADQNNPGNFIMMLQTGFPGGNASPVPAITQLQSNASCDILLGNDILPFHQPITLPSGCVIDLNYCSQNVQQLAAFKAVPTPTIPPNIDIIFSPRGNVTGITSALGALFFCIRSIQDATLPDLNNNNISLDPGYNGQVIGGTTTRIPSDTLILAVFPQTGLVQTFEADVTDVVNNQTGVAGADGRADNIFNFAQRGQSAGR